MIISYAIKSRVLNIPVFKQSRGSEKTLMASSSGRKLIQRSTTSARSLLSRTQRTQCASSGPSSKLGGFAPTSAPSPAFRLSPRRSPIFSSRLPVELSCAIESLVPLHSATASSLLRSMLSSKVGQWGVLSQG